MPGNTKDSNTLEEFLEKIEKQYGKAKRTWLMDRGMPTEETIEKMKNSSHGVNYLIDTPRVLLSSLEKNFLKMSWEEAIENVKVKLLEKDGEIYILVKSEFFYLSTYLIIYPDFHFEIYTLQKPHRLSQL